MLPAKQDNFENLIKHEEQKLLLATTSQSSSIMQKIASFQNELNNLLENRTKVAIVRSKARWAEHGEKNTKYFLNLGKRNNAKKAIHKIKSDRDTFITYQNAILTELVNDYAKLYNASACTEMLVKELENYIVRVELPKLSEDQKLLRDDPITLRERTTALYQLHTNKSPGLNRFFVEFHKAF